MRFKFLEGVGHCFTIAETTQNFTNANISPKKIMFAFFVKVWLLSVTVKQ